MMAGVLWQKYLKKFDEIRILPQIRRYIIQISESCLNWAELDEYLTIYSRGFCIPSGFLNHQPCNWATLQLCDNVLRGLPSWPPGAHRRCHCDPFGRPNRRRREIIGGTEYTHDRQYVGLMLGFASNKSPKQHQNTRVKLCKHLVVSRIKNRIHPRDLVQRCPIFRILSWERWWFGVQSLAFFVGENSRSSTTWAKTSCSMIQDSNIDQVWKHAVFKFTNCRFHPNARMKSWKDSTHVLCTMCVFYHH